MKNEIQNNATSNDAPRDTQPEIKRLSLRVRTKLNGGAFAVAPCTSRSCHNC